MEKIVFCDANSIKVIADGSVSELESTYIQQYRHNITAEQERHRWKEEGFSGRFQSGRAAIHRNDPIEASIRDAVFLSEDELCYSVTVGQMSGVFKKPLSEAQQEDHIVHAQDLAFFELCYNADQNTVAVSQAQSSFERSIALYPLNGNAPTELTSGDSKEQNPWWSLSSPGTLLFDSAGIGRDEDMNFVEYGPSALYSVNLLSRDIELIKEQEGLSLVQPKDDKEGNLFYIERPTKVKKKKNNLLLEVLLIPVKLVMAIISFLEVFTMMFTGKGFSSDSDPSDRMEKARNKNKKPHEILIDGNLIDAQKTYEENKKRKEEYAGIAPHSWKLICIAKDGTRTVLQEGVIAYDLTDSGDIVYTNGKNIVLLTKDGKKTRLAQTGLCTGVKVFRRSSPTQADLFD